MASNDTDIQLRIRAAVEGLAETPGVRIVVA